MDYRSGEPIPSLAAQFADKERGVPAILGGGNITSGNAYESVKLFKREFQSLSHFQKCKGISLKLQSTA